MRLGVSALLLGACLAVAVRAPAVQLDTMDPAVAWRLRSLDFEGADAIPASELERVVGAKPRTWWAVWRPLPPFDPIAFESDLGRIAALYRSRGYPHARVTHEVELPRDGDAVRVTVFIDEGAPVHVTRVHLDLPPPAPDLPDEAALRAALPLQPGDVFSEVRYVEGATALRTAYRRRGRARVQVTRTATVDVRDDTAVVRYAVVPGPPCTFGDVAVTGLGVVDEDVVLAEVAWTPGEPFDPKRLTATESRLRGLRLFRTIRLDEDPSDAARVNVTIHVAEAPPREIRLSAGYDTEEEFRGIAAWRSLNFFGGARQLGFTARVSKLYRTIAADFLQPHFPTPRSRTRLIFTQEQQDEDTYTLNLSRVLPRVDWSPRENVSVYGYYRAQLNLLQHGSVPDPVRAALPGAEPHTSWLSSVAFGVDWNATDDLLDPTRGWTTSTVVEPVGLGGDASFLRLVTDLRGYAPIGLGVVLASRLKLGTEQPWGSTTVVPLWERLYAGGVNSVRGYARRRVGPLAGDEPLGGESVVETSIELRRHIWDKIGGAVFFDAGQASLDPWTFPIDAMQKGTGFGVRYLSPVGPIRVDLGFPLDRRGDDAAWQVYLSVGETF